MNWYLAALKKYAVFSGRARRREYWFFSLINAIIFLGLAFIEGVMSVAVGTPQRALTILYTIAVFLPELGVAVRRLHDTGRTGMWLLIAFLPFVGWIVLLVFLLQDSQPGENWHGENPKGVAAG